MKKLKIILFFLFFAKQFFSQNLLPNPSFEIDTSCIPTAGGVNIGYMPPWDCPTDGTPDADNTCSPISSCSIPYNGWGFQYPHSGNAYVGICFYATLSTQDYREYLQIELDSTLIAQQVYCASFYVSLANSTRIACNNFGIYFTTTHTYKSTYDTINRTPQINNTNVITDTTNWVLISGQYVAQGGERYIIIGNFFPNSLTDTIHTMTTGNPASYYYLDDVNVHHCAQTGVQELGKVSDYRLYPNPNNGSMVLEYSIENTDIGVFSIYDVSGRLVKEVALTNADKKISIDASVLNAGAYYYTIKVNEGKVKADKLIIVK